MARQSLILIGAGGYARSCIDVIERQDKFQVAGLVGKPEEIGKAMLGYPIIATDRELADLAGKFRYALIAVGQVRSPDLRVTLFSTLKNFGFELPVIISPLAYVSPHASVGEGTIVMHGATVNAGSSIGANCIINLHAVLDHDVEIGDHCHVSNGATLNGAVRIGEGSFVGSASTIKEGVSIGARCLIGMGVGVRHDVPDATRFIGGHK
jgi:sugar O-acyltransferase (sialic acid O-acetyltransferase NeuD family)